MRTALETMKANRDQAVREAERLEELRDWHQAEADRYEDRHIEAKKLAAAYQVAIEMLEGDRNAGSRGTCPLCGIPFVNGDLVLTDEVKHPGSTWHETCPSATTEADRG